MAKLPVPPAFREPASALMGTRAKVAVLRILASGAAPVSQRELARRSRLAPRSVGLALEDLVGLGLVHRHIGGREHFLSLAHDHAMADALKALIRADIAFFTDFCDALISEARNGAGAGLVILALVGSMARGEETTASDADLLLIGRTRADAERWRQHFLEAAPNLRSRFGARVNPIAYSVAEARARWQEGAAPLPEFVRDALVLVGAPLGKVLGT